MNLMWQSRGFTLIELVMVMVLLGVMATFTSQFVSIGTEIYSDASQREQLMSDARFALERLNRELRDAVPGSVRVEDASGSGAAQGPCLRFWPIALASRYLSLNHPVAGGLELTMVATQTGDLPVSGEQAIVYPIAGAGPLDQGCDYGNCVAEVLSSALDPVSTGVGRVKVTKVFAGESPARRIYFANRQVRYCVVGERLLRNASSLATGSLISAEQPVAEHLQPNGAYFYQESGGFSQEGALGARLVFERNGETVTFNHKVEVLNVP